MPSLTVHRIKRSDQVARLRKMKVSIDGNVAFALAPGESQSITLPEGTYVVVGRMDWTKSQPVSVDLDSNALCEVSMPYTNEHWYDIFKPFNAFKNLRIVVEIK
jgi:hypothetical protein